MSYRVPAAERWSERPAGLLPNGRRPAFRIGDLLLSCGVSRERLLDEARRAAELGSDLIDLGLAEGWIDEGVLLAELAARMDARVLDRPPQPEAGTPIEESLRLRSYRSRLANGETARIISPDGALVRALGEGKLSSPEGRLALIRRQDFIDALTAHGRDGLALRAATTLPPRFSARPEKNRPIGRERIELAFWIALVGGLVILMAAAPLLPLIVLPILLAPIFIGATMVAMGSVLASLRPVPPPPSLPDAQLPRYTILVPLYREAAVLGDLIARLSRIDYPRDRLEIFLLVEEDDRETREALAHFNGPGRSLFKIFVVPPGQPRTKPRALNAVLPFVTGTLLVVFDAEDAPEPDQLRRAASAFAVAPRELICLQARLGIANPYDGWLPWRFAVDYAALFDTIKSGAARLGWPVPLGGSSNHFRTEALRRVGAWDAWNVTEDADLGIRLARFRHKVGDLPSTTWEEAPASLRLWLNQRTRWMKGWMQTLLVQARAPRDLLGELGPFRAITISLIGLSVVLGALLLPFVVLAFGLRLASGVALFSGSIAQGIADTLLVASLLAAAMLETVPPLLALHGRRSLRLATAILIAPVIYALISFAAWRGLFELIRKPYHWHKTPHGLMRQAGGVGGLR